MKKAQEDISLSASGRGRTLCVQGDRWTVLFVAALYYFNRPLLLLVAGAAFYFFGWPVGWLPAEVLPQIAE
ncbi:MAG: hypothetical protein AB3N24_25150 [Leisingera sp.]